MQTFKFIAYLIDGGIQEGYCEGYDEYEAEKAARSNLIAHADIIEVWAY